MPRLMDSFPLSAPSGRPALLNRHLSIIHPNEDGDPFQTGDVYNGFRPQKWNIDTTSMPYLSHIKRLTQGWPHLNYLADFMEVSTIPLRWRHINRMDIYKRATRTRVTLLDVLAADQSHSQPLTTIDQLKALLKGPSDDNDAVNIRVYVVEDLSREVIEELGARFDIDPLFFRSQLCDFSWYNVREPWIELPDLSVVANQRSFFTMRFVQARYFRSKPSFKAAEQQVLAFNVLRRLANDNNYKPILDEEGAIVALTRSKASLWIRQNKSNESGVLGVLLVDPTVKEGYPLWKGHRPFKNSPTMRSTDFGGPPRTSHYDDVVYWTLQLLQQNQDSIKQTPRMLGLGTLYMICAEWLTIITYVTTRLTQIDWELEDPVFRLDPRGLDASLHKLHVWRRALPTYQTMVAEVLDRVLAPPNAAAGAASNPMPNSFSEPLPALRRDFEAVQSQLATLAMRVERIVAVVTAVINIEESKRALNHNKNFGRLTYLAVVFVPLSFVSSLFSMDPDLGSLRQTFWIYFSVAVPLTCLALALAAFYIQIRGLMGGVKYVKV